MAYLQAVASAAGFYFQVADRGFDKDGIEPVGNGPDAFLAEIVEELAQWRELAKTTKITVD